MEEQRREAIQKIEYSTRAMLKTTNETIKEIKLDGGSIPLELIESKLLHLLILTELKKSKPSVKKMLNIIDQVGELLA